MKLMWDKEIIIQDMWTMINLYMLNQNNTYKKILQKYGNIILECNQFNEEEKTDYLNMISKVLYNENDDLEDSMFSCHNISEQYTTLSDKLCDYNLIKKVFDQLDLNRTAIEEFRFLINSINDEIQNLNFGMIYNKKISHERMIKLYKEYLNSFKDKTKLNLFNKFNRIGKNLINIEEYRNPYCAGFCQNITNSRKYIMIFKSFPIDELLGLTHELEHAYDKKANKSNTLTEINSIISELYMLDFLVESSEINEQEYICSLVDIIKGRLKNVEHFNNMKTDFENVYYRNDYYYGNEIDSVVIDSSDITYLHSSLLAFYLYLNFSREEAFKIINDGLKNNTLESFKFNSTELIVDLNIFFEELFCQYHEINQNKKQRKRK